MGSFQKHVIVKFLLAVPARSACLEFAIFAKRVHHADGFYYPHILLPSLWFLEVVVAVSVRKSSSSLGGEGVGNSYRSSKTQDTSGKKASDP